MVDAFGAMSTDLSERILAEKIMLSSSPDANLVKRILTHVQQTIKSHLRLDLLVTRSKIITFILLCSL